MLAKKLLGMGIGLMLLGMVSYPVHADLELFKNFKVDGSIETRSFSINNETAVDNKDNATTGNGLKDDYRAETNVRMMLGTSFDLLDDVHSKILLDKVSRWGGSSSIAGYSAVGSQGSTSGENLETVENNIWVDNAYVKVDKVFGHVDMTIGRQFYGDPNSPVIYYGPNNDDILSINSVDLFRADADIMGWAKFQGIAGKVVDNGNGEPPLGVGNIGTNSDTDLWGGELNSDKVIPAGNLAAYYYTRQNKNQTDTAAAPGNNTLIVYGAHAAGDIKPVAGLGYHAEIIQDGGRDNSVAPAVGTSNAYTGTAYDLGLKYGRDLASMPARAKVDWSRGSDNFAAIAPSARYGIIWGEQTTQGPSTVYGNAATLSNVDIFDVGVGINPIQKLGIDLNWYRIMYDAVMAGVDGRSAGNELDLILSWKHSDNVYFEVNAATFQVGGALDNSGHATDPINRLGADVKIKF